jgi:hypothetical protein
MIRFFASGLLSLALLTGPARAAGHFATVPHTPDPAAYYLFYLHGTFLEKHPDGTPHPRSGTPYDWSGIVKSFVERGFTVISEVRSSGTRSRNYADKIKDQIAKLLAGGVAPQRITVAGHSKGGSIVLHTAAIAQNPELNFINLAGCGDRGRFARNFRRFVDLAGARVTGRLMSIYDRDDRIAGSCAAIRDAGAKVEFSEKVLTTGEGHHLFYRPARIWMDEVEKFAKRRNRTG